MSILTFLLFTSVIYFASSVGSADAASTAAVTSPSDQDRVNTFMAVMEKSFVENLSPTLSSMNKDDQDYLKITTLDGIGSFINFIFFRKQLLNDSETATAAQNVTDDDIILQFKTLEPFSPVYVSDQLPCLTDEDAQDEEQ